MPDPNLFYLPIGVDFAEELVLGLRERMVSRPPEDMARVRLIVNSNRMRRRVLDELTSRGTGFLPQIGVVTDLGADIASADLAGPEHEPELRQRLELAKLIKGLLQAQPELAPISARFDLAESLADLLAEMQDEGVDPAALHDLDMSGHSVHWARTQAFLNIITALYHSRSSQQLRQRAAVIQMIGLWQSNPPRDPVIIAGSTGSRGTTEMLMEAIARLEKGAVILPGFDTNLPPQVWYGMNDAMTDEDHPQFRFRKLMFALDVTPTRLRGWRIAQPCDPDRNRLVSLALRPAPVTDQWLVDGASLPDLRKASENLTLIEATHPREEALAIALVLRHAVELGQRAALITPDRNLSRRVSAALSRWGLVPDDSAGRPLAMSANGRLLRHVAQGFTAPLTADQLLILLKHPLTSANAYRPAHLALTRALEDELRRNGPAFPDAATLHAWSSKLGDDATFEWSAWVAEILAQFIMQDGAPLTIHVTRHVALAQQLSQGPQSGEEMTLFDGAAGNEAQRLMALLTSEAPYGDDMSNGDYASFFETQINKGEVRDSYSAHPLVAIYGSREAREMQAEVVVVGGLTDGVWPAVGDPDPWLNRTMRKESGLLLPERQIGLAAHDFQQVMSFPQVIMTRSVRDAEAETVPSRWLNRLGNLMEGLPQRNGPAALAEMRARGRIWLDMARAIERPTAAQKDDLRLLPASRPSPRPPLTDRPDRLSLSRIATLIRDPFAIYARYILRLKPLNPLRHVPEDRDRGILIHKILEEFVRDRPVDEPSELARQRLIHIAKNVLKIGTPFPSARLLWMARLERAVSHLLRQDAKYHGQPVMVEQMGAIRVGQTGFTLFGTPDRIDLLPDGRLHLIDYKTGTPPTKAQQESFEKQLLLAAAMAEGGGFADLGPVEVARISYIGLGSGEKSVETEVDAALLTEQWDRFTQLIQAYSQHETGYVARRAVFESRFAFDYDHLSRFGEWQMSDRARPTVVGAKHDLG